MDKNVTFSVKTAQHQEKIDFWNFWTFAKPAKTSKRCSLELFGFRLRSNPGPALWPTGGDRPWGWGSRPPPPPMLGEGPLDPLLDWQDDFFPGAQRRRIQKVATFSFKFPIILNFASNKMARSHPTGLGPPKLLFQRKIGWFSWGCDSNLTHPCLLICSKQSGGRAVLRGNSLHFKTRPPPPGSGGVECPPTPGKCNLP